MADTTLPQNTDELIQRIETEWDLLLKAIARADERSMSAPDAGGWSPKDNLAHISAWMNVLLDHHFGAMTMEESLGVPPVDEVGGFDEINARVVALHRNRSLADVLKEMKEVYAKTVAHLRQIPFGELLKPRHPERPDSELMLHSVIGDTYEHFAEHRESIEKALSAK